MSDKYSSDSENSEELDQRSQEETSESSSDDGYLQKFVEPYKEASKEQYMLNNQQKQVEKDRILEAQELIQKGKNSKAINVISEILKNNSKCITAYEMMSQIFRNDHDIHRAMLFELAGVIIEGNLIKLVQTFQHLRDNTLDPRLLRLCAVKIMQHPKCDDQKRK